MYHEFPQCNYQLVTYEPIEERTGQMIERVLRRPQTPVSGKKALAVAVRDGLWCRCCGIVADLTMDHVVPQILGGKSTIENLQILCGSCNSSKGASLACKLHASEPVNV